MPEDLVLYAESPEEARGFLRRAARARFSHRIAEVYVAKRAPTARGNQYLTGRYYRTTNDEHVDVFDDIVASPRGVTDLTQWCTCDVMLATVYGTPVAVVEDTTHIVRMNLYQRFPRLARASMLGVPAAVLQGTRGLEMRLRGDRWGLFRYLQAFRAVAAVHPEAPALPFWYLPDAAAELRAEGDLFRYLDAVVEGDSPRVASYRDAVTARIDRVLSEVGGVPPDINSIDHTSGPAVVVKVGARPDRKSWREKGSGQMDPYVGLILAAKYIYCFDERGRQIRELVVEFTHLPPGFWWFANPEPTALYKRLPLEFADTVRFLGADTA